MRSITLGSNIASLQGVRRLSENSASLSQTFERLSSGMRINRASDDAAGLSVQTGLNLDRRIYSQGVRNINDGLSALNIADSTLSQASNIVTRLRELAEQSSTGTFGAQQRKSLDTEAQALAAEFSRITKSASFNGLNLFDGSLQGFRVQGGYGTDGSIFSSLGGAMWSGGFDSVNALGQTVARDIATADLNGDGLQDIVNVTNAGISVRFGNGDGNFGASTSYDMSLTTGYVVSLADFNNDGTLDVVAGGIGAGGGVYSIRFGQGDGTFGNATSYYGGSTGAVRSIAIGDLNSDGLLDVVAANQTATAVKGTIRLGNGNGNLGSYSNLGITASVTGNFDIQLADLNNDGALDVMVGAYGALRYSLGNGDGTFSSNILDPGFGGSISRFKDLNGDGKLDLVSFSGSNILIGLGNGDGTFGAASTFAAGNTVTNIRIADFDGDGKYDIVASLGSGALSSGDVSILLGNGNGTFTAGKTQNLGYSALSGLALADFNNDGVLDVAFSNAVDGANTIKSQTKDGVNPILEFSLRSMADARQALSQFANLGNRISAQRGVIGAFQSRINIASAVLSVTVEQSAAAESRILDVDVAQESAELVRKTILQQAAASVLAQANQQPALALRLLQ